MATQQVEFQEDEYEFDEQIDIRRYEGVITCDETKHKEDRKALLTEIKEFDSITKSLSELLISVAAVKEKFEKRLQAISNVKEVKRSVIQRKDKVESYIYKADLQPQYRALFISNLTEMKMPSFEDVIKAYFDNNLLKNTTNYQDIAITLDEFTIHSNALAENDESNYITTKDIPVLIKRMYRVIDVATYVNDDITINLEYSELVSKPPHNVIATLQDMNLIKIDYQGISTNSTYSRSEALAPLLDQIPRLKYLNLVTTNMKGYTTVDGLIKLIMTLQDPLRIYYKLNKTEEASTYVKELELSVIDYNDDFFFKLESLQKAFKLVSRSKKQSLPTKDAIFYKLLSNY